MTERLFATHTVRRRRELDGLWQVGVPGARPGEPDRRHRVLVPSVIESVPGLENFRGVARYERDLDAAGLLGAFEGEAFLHLVCKGVGHTAEVYVDGAHLAHHYNAYTAFDALTAHTPGTRTVRIDADNRFGPDSALHRENDYYSYGGLSRPVIAEIVPAAYIEHLHLTPFRQGGTWHLRVRVQLASAWARTGKGQGMSSTAEVTLVLDGHEVAVLTQADATGVPGRYERVLAVPGAQAYQLDAPHLSLMQALLHVDGQLVDDLIERFGFREVRVDGTRVLFNDEEIRFVGFNRHEDHPTFGCAIPLEAMAKDLLLLQDLGATSVRTSHYPNDERFLDLCDELGLLVWEEAHARGKEEERNPLFAAQSLAGLDEMVTQHHNHPAIFTWGILNEYESDTEYGRAIYEQMYARLRELDPSRPTTSATCWFPTDICLDLPDIVAINIYPLWYHEETVAEYVGGVLDFIDSSPGAGKPLIVSEIGAGAIYGNHDPRRAKWSEERQAEILTAQLEHLFTLPQLTGTYLWQFADCRVTDGWFAVRPRTMNNKGIVDEHRRPKLAYTAVRELFAQYRAQHGIAPTRAR